jgi:hypothetical protein
MPQGYVLGFLELVGLHTADYAHAVCLGIGSKSEAYVRQLARYGSACGRVNVGSSATLGP